MSVILKKQSISVIFFILLLLFFYSVLKNNILDWQREGYPSVFAEALDPIVNQAKDKTDIKNNSMVQINYFSELTRAFLNKQTYLLVKPNKELIDQKNPYGPSALKFTLQDASLFKDKYYIYYNPLPVLSIYIPFYYLFKKVPTDNLILTVLSLVYGSIIYALTILMINRKSLTLGSVFFTAALFNPIFLNSFKWFVTSNVSRYYCIICMMISYGLMFYVKNNKNLVNKKESFLIFLSIFFATLASISRNTYLIDLLIVSIFIFFKFRAALRFRFWFFAFSPFAIFSLLNFYYNFIRFDNFFENGQRYIVNGMDYINNGSILRIPHNVFEIFANYIYRFYEYFLLLPSYNYENSKIMLNMTTSPFMLSRNYTEGTIGIFYYVPVLFPIFLFFLKFCYEDIYTKKNHDNPNKLIVYLTFTGFIFNFFLISLVPNTTIFYTSEFYLRFLIFLFFYMYFILELKKNSFFKHLIIFLLIVGFSHMFNFSRATWLHF